LDAARVSTAGSSNTSPKPILAIGAIVAAVPAPASVRSFSDG
jgi:hypothetical protein